MGITILVALAFGLLVYCLTKSYMDNKLKDLKMDSNKKEFELNRTISAYKKSSIVTPEQIQNWEVLFANAKTRIQRTEDEKNEWKRKAEKLHTETQRLRGVVTKVKSTIAKNKPQKGSTSQRSSSSSNNDSSMDPLLFLALAEIMDNNSESSSSQGHSWSGDGGEFSGAGASGSYDDSSSSSDYSSSDSSSSYDSGGSYDSGSSDSGGGSD